jgi:hypothetical protein
MTKLNINFKYTRKYRGKVHGIVDLLESQGFKAYYLTFTSLPMRELHPGYDAYEDAVPGRTRKEAERVLRKLYKGVRDVRLERKISSVVVLSSRGLDVAVDIIYGKFKW